MFNNINSNTCMIIDNNEHLQFINYNCKYTIVQSKLMFLL
jgi:hypothetical protein